MNKAPVEQPGRSLEFGGPVDGALAIVALGATAVGDVVSSPAAKSILEGVAVAAAAVFSIRALRYDAAQPELPSAEALDLSGQL